MFKLEIKTGNAAFADYPMDELARILREVAEELEGAMNAGTVQNINGNTVGSYSFTEETEDVA